MFGSNSLPLPPPFAHDHHRPLRLNPESSRPLPTGECRYVLLHPSVSNQQCSCQSFHLNRSAPGSICECGHQACFHVHYENNNEKTSDTLNPVLDKLNAVLDKVKRMEETIQNERGTRESAFQRERQMWEREVRILREALATFYQSEKEMRRRLADIEDRVEGNYDDHVRLRDRVVAVDNATIAMEKRVEEFEGLRTKRRRVNHQQGPEPPLQNGYVSSDPDNFRRVPSSVDGASVHTPSSRALSPNGIPPAPTEPEGPRSSGILNLVAEMPRPLTFINMPQRLSPPQEEPRSSGFLTLDLGERLKEKIVSEQAAQVARHQAARITPPQDRPSPPGSIKSNPEVPTMASRTPPQPANTKLPLVDLMIVPVHPGNTSPRKRKHHLDHIALDVLADVTVASPLIH